MPDDASAPDPVAEQAQDFERFITIRLEGGHPLDPTLFGAAMALGRIVRSYAQPDLRRDAINQMCLAMREAAESETGPR
jgi:Flp pilus assembly CpaE family ATPase